MIGKCLLALAVVSQIVAFKYNQESISYAKPEQSGQNNFKYTYQPIEKYQRIVATSTLKSTNQNQNIGYVRPAITAAPLTRNVVARGKYPVTLQNAGPVPEKKIPVVTSHVRAPVQEKPTVRLQAKIPAPKTIAHTCTCYKTIVKPRVQQHLISVPTIQRYIETLHRPVVENIHYEAYPVHCLKTTNEETEKEKPQTQTYQVQPIEVASIRLSSEGEKNSGIQTLEFPSGQSFEVSKPQNGQVIEIPRIQFTQGEKSQTVEIPRVQFIQSKKPQTVEIAQGIALPRLQFLESQKSETIQLPQTQFLENKTPQFVEILNAQSIGNNKAENVQLPRLEFLQAQKVQTVEIPRIQVEESPKMETLEIPHEGGTITFKATPFTFQSKH